MSLPVAFGEPAVSIKARQYGELFRRYIVPQLPFVVTLGMLLFVSLGLQLALPLIVRHFIDEAQRGASVEALSASAVAFIAIAVVQQFVQVFATYFSERVGWTATNNIREDLAEHALSLDMSYHNDRTPGEMIERVDGDPNELGKFFSLFIFEMLGSLLLLTGILVLLLREDWRAGLALTVFVVAGMAILTSIRNIAVPYWKANREASADTFGFLEERLAGTEDIRSNDAKAVRDAALPRADAELVRQGAQGRTDEQHHVQHDDVHVRCRERDLAVAGGRTCSLEARSAWGTVYLIFHYTQMLVMPINRFTQQLDSFQRASAGHLAHPGAERRAEDGAGPAGGGPDRAVREEDGWGTVPARQEFPTRIEYGAGSARE